MKTVSHVSLLHDQDKTFLGVFLSPEIWDMVQSDIVPVLEKALDRLDPDSKPAPKPEPVKDWDNLAAFWDFKYPLTTEVSCPSCGESTADWREEPRKFRLAGANLAGLAAFNCLGCGAKVVRKHFKDHIAVECHTKDGALLRDKIPQKIVK